MLRRLRASGSGLQKCGLQASGFGPWAVLGAWALVAVTVTAVPARAQETHLLIVAGVSGDEAHAKQFHGWASSVVDGAKKHGVPDPNVTYLAERVELDPERIDGRSARDVVSKTLTDLAARTKPNDEVFVLLIGHGSFDGKTAAFNLPGPDLTAQDYASLLGKFGTQRIVFVNTASSSGAFVEPLRGPGRTIVAATRTGGERNETRFPGPFVEALSTDVDGAGESCLGPDHDRGVERFQPRDHATERRHERLTE